MPYQFVGNLQGMQAVATVEFEQLHNYVLMEGDVKSQNGNYAFSADIYGDGGYGDMVDRMTGERFRIQIQNLAPAGFALVVNPYEGLYSTRYDFRRSG